MTREEYRGQLVICYYLARMLMATPLPEMANMIAHADSIGVLIDPTAWMRGEKHMHEDEQVIRILRDAAAELRKLPWPAPAAADAGGAS